jgi:hypothetical protein
MQKFESYDTVMTHYNALYCNRSYMAAKIRVGGLALDVHTANSLMTRLIDASLECCGHLFFKGSTAHLFWLVRLFGDDCLDGLVMEHLMNFATPEYIEQLKGVKADAR